MAWTSHTFAYGSVLTSTKMTQNFDNFTALAQGLTGAPALVGLRSVYYSTGAVATGGTIIPDDDTIPQNTEGDQYMSLSYTPALATSYLIITVFVNLTNSSLVTLTAALFRDSTADSIGTASLIQNADWHSVIAFSVKVPSNAASSTTFTVRAGGAASGTTTFNGQASARKYGGALVSSIEILEVAA